MSGWPPDFADAAQRHWEDGSYLFADARWPNADHLFGIAAECGLKAVMVGLGMPVDSRGDPMTPHKAHINVLWDRFRTFATTPGAANYAAMLPISNPFSDWSVDQRYSHGSNFVEAQVELHRLGTLEVREVVKTAIADGRI